MRAFRGKELEVNDQLRVQASNPRRSSRCPLHGQFNETQVRCTRSGWR